MKKLRFELVVIILLVIGFMGVVAAQGNGEKIEINHSESTYKINGETYELSPDSEETSFIKHENGRFQSGSFKVLASRSFPLGDQDVELPKGAIAKFDDDMWKITMPENEQVKTSKNYGTKFGETIIEYQNMDEFEIEGYKFDLESNQKLVSKDGKLFLKGLGTTTIDGNVQVKITPDQNPMVYISTQGDIEGYISSSYISLNKNKGIFVAGSNNNQPGPKINLLHGNSYASFLGQDQSLAFQPKGNSLGNFVAIENGQGIGLVPKIHTLNEAIFDDDTLGFEIKQIGGQWEFYKDPNNALVGFDTAKFTNPIEVSNYIGRLDEYSPLSTSQFRGKDVENVLLIGDYNAYAYGPTPSYMKALNYHHPSLPNVKVGISNKLAFYGIKTINDFNSFFGGSVNLKDNGGGFRPTPHNLRLLTDLLGGLPENYWVQGEFNPNNPLRIVSKNMGPAGRAWTHGLVELDTNNPGVWAHEFGHIHHFNAPGGFWSDWKSVGYNPRSSSLGFVSSYSRTNYAEDVAETMEEIATGRLYNFYNTQHGHIVRGKAAVFYKHGFISETQFRGIGLEPGKTDQYINDARKFTGRMG
jgi:hypothetical protein